ncbi:ribosome production factor 2 homolog [Daktulosphaira vitifoliae]|uniref:ribosome production factor 2 homolog n=1 Tax=Daktulosphaira vitifoliae TaxID=58002 RepID=UPI0021AA13CA|nr:ribosome production factor 2 homolog [Daktulosphaira vitifoliae]
MGVIQRVAKPRTKRGKRVLLKREPKVIENVKQCIFIPGRKVSQTSKNCLVDLLKLKKPDAVMLTQKNDILPFDDTVQIEKLLQKHDASLFFFSSHNKKRPNNIVLGRTYDQHVLDMFELGIESYKSCTEFKGLSEITAGVKPVLVFLGDQFDSDQQLKRLRNLLVDMFQRQQLKQIRPNGVQLVLSFTAVDNKVLLRSYRSTLSKTSIKTPRVELNEVGPSVDFVLRRDLMASADLFKTACKRISLKGKKIKGVRRDNFGSKLGRLHMTKQDVNKLQTRKMKGLKKTFAEKKMKRMASEENNDLAIKKSRDNLKASPGKKLKKFSKKGRKLRGGQV